MATMNLEGTAYSFPSLPEREERGEGRWLDLLGPPLSGSLPTRPSRGEREANAATLINTVRREEIQLLAQAVELARRGQIQSRRSANYTGHGCPF